VKQSVVTQSQTAVNQPVVNQTGIQTANPKVDRLLLGLIVVLGGVLVWQVSGTLDQRVIAVGDTAPQFKVTTDSGRTITATDFGGKLLVLNFWASWCPPCVEETPSLDAFTRMMAPEGVVVLGVSIDKNEAMYKRFLQRFQPAYETSRDADADISTSYGTFVFPETYIIDRSGTVVQKIIGEPEKGDWTDPELLARIRRFL
jgi:cytochrome c biogenesis protein CcmG/thiol:disulfide interchange protein DsbE